MNNLNELYEWLKNNPQESIKDIQRLLDETRIRQNSVGLPEFCGLSPEQMYGLLYRPFEAGSPIGFCDFVPDRLDACPIFCTAEDILRQTVLTKKSFKMTEATGSLPVKQVKAIYEESMLKDSAIAGGITKLNRESDANFIHAARLVLEMTPAIRKQHGHWHLTKKGEKLVLPANRVELFQEFFRAFALRFNWAYFDGVRHPTAGQFGFGWLLAALSHFGKTERTGGFYGKKYLNAFPTLPESAEQVSWDTPENMVTSGVEIRFFLRFCYWFGLAEVTDGGFRMAEGERLRVRKTGLLEDIFVLPAMTDPAL